MAFSQGLEPGSAAVQHEIHWVDCVRLKELQEPPLVVLHRLERARKVAAIEIGGVVELSCHGLAERRRGGFPKPWSSSAQVCNIDPVLRSHLDPGYRSMHIATPMPPPTQSVARPFLASRRCISCSRCYAHSREAGSLFTQSAALS